MTKPVVFTCYAARGLAEMSCSHTDLDAWARPKEPIRHGLAGRSRALRYYVAVDIEPSPAFANETAAFMLANGGGITDPRAGNELHFGRIVAGGYRVDNSEP